MFSVEDCYKIIFEALLSKESLSDIVQKVHNYTEAQIYILLMSGEILACTDEKWRPTTYQKRYLSLTDFSAKQEYLYKMEEPVYLGEMDKYLHTECFEVDGKKIGYSVFIYSGKPGNVDIRKVNTILCRALGIYLKNKDIAVYGHIPMKRQICAKAIFAEENEEKEIEELKKILHKEYFLAYTTCEKEMVNRQKLLQQMQGIWKECYFEFEDDGLYTFFSGVDEDGRKAIIEGVKQLGAFSCVSELFGQLERCASKCDFLKQMNSLNALCGQINIMEEKEWYVETVFSYATDMFKESGLLDYDIEQLRKEDKNNNLELYDTLKMYMLCENNISSTATKLHIHRNTLVYRLKQIQNCIGKNINDSMVSKELLSFMLMYDITRQNED